MVWAKDRSARSREYPFSLHQSRKLDRNPCAVAIRPGLSLWALSLRSREVRAMSESSTWSRTEGNTSVSCWLFCLSRIAMIRGGRGTRWGAFAFMRSAGIVHTLFLKSTSLQVIPRASPERQAVKITNSSSVRVTSGRLPGLRCSCTNSGMSRHGMAGWCWVRRALPGCCARRWPTTSTGFDWQ